jgi:hypothetical protein
MADQRVPHRGLKTEAFPTMTEFKVGDRVRVRNLPAVRADAGRVGTVVGVKQYAAWDGSFARSAWTAQRTSTPSSG